MKSSGRFPFLPVGAMLLCSGIYLQPVWADVYAYTTRDGAVKLSNVASDSRCSVLVLETKLNTSATSTPKSARPFSISNKVHYDELVDEVAKTYGLESALLHAVISVESRYTPNAVSKKGAMGLMQLMPRLAKHYGVSDPFDPTQNLHGGAKHLRYLLNKYKNDRSLALAAYNAGERKVAKYGNRIPPYQETTDYVPRVLGFYQKYQSGAALPLARTKAELVNG